MIHVDFRQVPTTVTSNIKTALLIKVIFNLYVIECYDLIEEFEPRTYKEFTRTLKVYNRFQL